MAHQGSNVRIDRGDGHVFNIAPAEVDKFIAANPGAFVVGGKAEDKATEAVESQPADDGADFDAMTLPQLHEYAADNGIDLGGATLKADVLEKVKAGSAKE